MRYRLFTGMLPFLMVIGILFNSCKHEPLVPPQAPAGLNGGGGVEPEPEDTCDPNIIWFEQEVLPIFLTHCTMSGCHGDVSPNDADMVFTSHAGLNSDPNMIPDIWEAINEDPDDNDHMPPLVDDLHNPLDQLTPEEIAIIGAWIDQGANNNSCDGGCDMTAITYSGTILPIVQDRCQGSCHAGNNPDGGLDFTTWTDLNAVAADGTLALAIQHQAGAEPMPQSGPALSQCRIDQFLAWIQDGAPNN